MSAVYDAMSLARRPGDCVRKEYKVDPVARGSNKGGPALDIVYIGKQASTHEQSQEQVFIPPPIYIHWLRNECVLGVPAYLRL